MHPSLHARQTPDKPAVIMAASGSVLTYAELEARANQGAHLLRGIGLKNGDGIAFMLDNDPIFFEAVWAAQRTGLYYTCISTRLAPAEVAYILRDSHARALVTTAAHYKAFRDILPDIAVFLTDGSDVPGTRDFRRERAAFPETPMADEAPGNDMLYSSGTTGRPKGVRPPLPDSFEAHNRGLTEFAIARYAFSQDMIYLSPAPLYHSAPLRWCMTVQKLGGTVVVMDKFDPEDALAAIEHYHATHAQFVPTHFVRMLKLPDDVRRRHYTSSLKVAFHAAAPCPVPVKQAMMAWWGPVIHEYYSGTEAAGFTSIGPEEWLAHPGSVGREVWGEIRICNEDGDPLPQGEAGLIYFANSLPFEYHNDPEKTAASRNRHGWSTLGDIGWVDPEGYLYLTDRQSFMIISGGVNIYPQEIENLLVTHPKVADAAVIGAPDEDMGEQVVAVIQPLEWADAGPALAAELSAWLAPQIAKIKLPRRIDFDAELPRHPTGKLYKRKLRDRYWPAKDAR